MIAGTRFIYTRRLAAPAFWGYIYFFIFKYGDGKRQSSFPVSNVFFFVLYEKLSIFDGIRQTKVTPPPILTH